MIGVTHIVVAMKPIEGTFAENALKHGVAGINVDGCRVGTETRTYKGSGAQPHKLNAHGKGDTGIGYMDGSGKDMEFTATGRWPSNLIHDGSDEVVGMFPVTTNTRHMSYQRSGGEFIDGIPSQPDKDWFVNETGSAARFFFRVKEFEEQQSEQES